MAHSITTQVAEVFCRRSKYGLDDDPQLGISDICGATGLSRDAVVAALGELAAQHLVKVRGPNPLTGTQEDENWTAFHSLSRLFVLFDQHFMNWDPRRDAEQLAAAVPTAVGQSLSVDQFIVDVGWSVRRVNPAIALLLSSRRFQSTKVYVGDGLVDKGLHYRGRF